MITGRGADSLASGERIEVDVSGSISGTTLNLNVDVEVF